MKSRVVGRTVALSVLMAGCGDGAGAQARTELPATARAVEVRVDTLFRLGGVEGEGWQQFERVRDIGFDGRGLLLRSVGRRGDGPGELSAPYAMAVAPDGTVAVSDLRRRSVALFAPDGTYLDNVRLDGARGAAPATALDGRGNALGAPPLVWSGRTGSSDLTLGVRTRGGIEEDPVGLPILRMPLDGGDAEVLAHAWIPRREGEDGRPVETAFLPRTRWAVLPGGRVALVDSLDSRIRVVGEGAPTVLTRAVEPRPVTRRDREGEVERRAADTGDSTGRSGAGMGTDAREATRAMLRERRAQLEAGLRFFPEHQVVRGLRADLDGRIWVERLGRTPWEEGPIDVLTPSGEYLGTIEAGALRLPDALGPGGLAAWLETDAFDVPVVTVGRVRLGSR